MKYAEFMKEKRRQGKPPTLKPRQWTPVERERAQQCICIHCGIEPAGETSYLCPGCESAAGESIESQINDARRRCLERRPETPANDPD